VGDPQVTHLKALNYSPNGTITYKLRHTEEWQHYGTRRTLNNIQAMDILPPLYSQRRKIKTAKFQDLQTLKHSLHSDYYDFYDKLPHE
jgi:hypothetical protein